MHEGFGVGRLAAAVAPRVRLPAQRVLHLLEAHVGHGDGRGALLLEARLAVEGQQEVLADEQRSPQAGHAAQVLQVAPQQDGALALLPTLAVDGQHVDVHRGRVGHVLRHGFLDQEHTNRRVSCTQGWGYMVKALPPWLRLRLLVAASSRSK